MACRERGRSARGDSFIWTFESQQLAESQLQNREDYLFLWGPRSRTQPLGVLCSSAPPVPPIPSEPSISIITTRRSSMCKSPVVPHMHHGLF